MKSGNPKKQRERDVRPALRLYIHHATHNLKKASEKRGAKVIFTASNKNSNLVGKIARALCIYLMSHSKM